MKSKTLIIILVLGVFSTLFSCKISPQKINYGKDHCSHCDMTVVDKTHASQYVTKKGKAYMFDAVECLVMQLNKDDNEDKLAFILVTDYVNPGDLVDAKNATYLISDKIKSPMGANLSAFLSKEVAENYAEEKGGELYTFSELKIKFAN